MQDVDCEIEEDPTSRVCNTPEDEEDGVGGSVGDGGGGGKGVGGEEEEGVVVVGGGVGEAAGASTLFNNSREMRNKAEKMRRDKLNSFIGELATLVPMVARSSKRMDKTSILRLTATHLRIYQTISNGECTKNMDIPKEVDQFLLEELVCEQLGGFLLILTLTAKIVFVSHTVEHLLGHLQTDLMGQSIFNLVATDDYDRLKSYINAENEGENEGKRYFSIRLKRAGPRTETTVYEPVTMMGMHRQSGKNNQQVQQHRDILKSYKTSHGASQKSPSTTNSYNNDLMLFFVRVSRPEPIAKRLIEASKDEYMTRHLIDGRIINCDQRISFIAGYMTEEVSGISAFKFMHKDDVRWVMIALRQMYDRRESKGNSCYRLISRNGQFIYLRTYGFLEIDDQGTVESFVCVNSLVDETEGLKLISEMKKKFSAIINSKKTSTEIESITSKEESVEDPVKVEEAIVHLITNLPSPSCTDSRSTPSPKIVYPMKKELEASAPSATATSTTTTTTTTIPPDITNDPITTIVESEEEDHSGHKTDSSSKKRNQSSLHTDRKRQKTIFGNKNGHQKLTAITNVAAATAPSFSTCCHKNLGMCANNLG